MKDQQLNEHLECVTESLKSRERQLRESKGNHREIGWYIDAINAAKRRINDLENEMADVVTARDDVALRMLPMASANTRQGFRDRIRKAYRMADIFQEVRHETQAGEF